MDEKENNKLINKKVFENIIIAVILMIYFIVINYLYEIVPEEKVILGLKVSCMVILAIGITIFEVAYRKDSGKLAINGIEALVIASYTLSISYVVQVNNFNFYNYILSSSYVFSIYYILKAIFVYTREKKKYLNSLSDIKEIVKNNPQKKETTKKRK